MGLAFAIPIDVAMNTVNQLKDKGRVTRGRIGVQIQEVTKETAEAFGLPKPRRRAGQLGREGRPGRQGRRRGRRHHPQGRRPRRAHVERAAAHHHAGPAGHQDHARRSGARATQRDIAVTVAEMQGRRRGARSRARGAPRRRRRRSPTGWASCSPTSPTSRRRKLDVKSGVLVEDIAGGVRGNVQPGDVILAIVSRGQTTEAKSAEQVNDLLAKLDKGASVDAAPEARRAAVLRHAAPATNGE